MHANMTRGVWRKRLHTMSRLLLPSRLIKVFPPRFTMRDPVLSLVNKARKKNLQVALILFHLEDYHAILKAMPHTFTDLMQKRIRSVFKEILESYVTESDLIGVKQIHSDDIVVFVRIDSPEAYSRCNLVAGQMMEELEKRLQRLFSLYLEKLKFQTGCALLEDHPDTEIAVETAYHYAMASAAKNLPAHFALQYLQLEEILKTEHISVLTQPIMDLKSGEIYGWEILTRGPKNSPFHNPAELFEFADQAELLPELEWMVIRKALREISERQIKEQVFINITPVSLSDPQLLGRLLEQFKQHDLNTSQIIFEITERHSINDFEQMASILRSYRAQGFRFAVDDAGSGYSSLQSMSELIPDIIKIDKSVIRNIDRESVKQAMLRSLLYFAENINCTVIAEGVEREEEANILLQNKVHMGQGYYFAKPQPFEHGRNVVHFETLKAKIIHMRQKAAAV